MIVALYVGILTRKATTSQVKFGYFSLSLIRRHIFVVLGAFYGLHDYAAINIVIL